MLKGASSPSGRRYFNCPLQGRGKCVQSSGEQCILKGWSVQVYGGGRYITVHVHVWLKHRDSIECSR